MSKGVSFEKPDGTKLKIGIAVSRWNSSVTFSLRDKAKQAILDSGVKEKDIEIIHVPGTYELPQAARYLLKHKKVQAVIAIGCLIKGQTLHFEYIASAVSYGLIRLSLDEGVPVVGGIFACLYEKQALERSGDSRRNHGYAWGLTAVEMAALYKAAKTRKIKKTKTTTPIGVPAAVPFWSFTDDQAEKG